jgi:hypothetical protein
VKDDAEYIADRIDEIGSRGSITASAAKGGESDG